MIGWTHATRLSQSQKIEVGLTPYDKSSCDYNNHATIYDTSATFHTTCDTACATVVDEALYNKVAICKLKEINQL